MGTKLKRNISGYFEIPYRVSYYDAKTDETCNYLQCDKLYIREVIYNDPVTIVLWSDGTKTASKAHGDDAYSKEAGLAICVLKRLVKASNVHDIFEDWIMDNKNRIGISDVRKTLKLTKKAEEKPAIEIEPSKKSIKNKKQKIKTK